MLRHARRIPTVPVARRMELAELASARLRASPRVSWTSIFIRAYGLVAVRYSHLRRVWVSWPKAHLFELPFSDCRVVVERQWQGETALFFGEIAGPEGFSLDEIHALLRGYKTCDIPSNPYYRRQLRLARLPAPLRRLALWRALNTSGRRRVKYAGTFGITNYGMLGSESLHPIGPATTAITLGPIDDGGSVTVKIVYDHRVVDGSYIARSLQHLEDVLQTQILAELGHSPLKVAA